MVDRYLLPVPKTKNSRMYVRFPESRKKVAGGLFFLSFIMMTFQINRYFSTKIVIFLFYFNRLIKLFDLIIFKFFRLEENRLDITWIGITEMPLRKLDISQMDYNNNSFYFDIFNYFNLQRCFSFIIIESFML